MAILNPSKSSVLILNPKFSTRGRGHGATTHEPCGGQSGGTYGGFIGVSWGDPQNGWCMKGKSHLEMDDDWGYPYFRKPPYKMISVCRSAVWNWWENDGKWVSQSGGFSILFFWGKELKREQATEIHGKRVATSSNISTVMPYTIPQSALSSWTAGVGARRDEGADKTWLSQNQMEDPWITSCGSLWLIIGKTISQRIARILGWSSDLPIEPEFGIGGLERTSSLVRRRRQTQLLPCPKGDLQRQNGRQCQRQWLGYRVRDGHFGSLTHLTSLVFNLQV